MSGRGVMADFSKDGDGLKGGKRTTPKRPSLIKVPMQNLMLSTMRDSSKTSMVLLAICWTIYFFYSLVLLLCRQGKETMADYAAPVVCFVFGGSMWWICRNYSFGGRVSLSHAKALSLSVTMCLTMGVLLTLRLVSHDFYDGNIFRDQDTCGRGYLPQDLAVILVFLPVVLDSAFPILGRRSVTLCCVIVFGFLFGNMIAFDVMDSLATVLSGIVMCSFVLVSRSIATDQWMDTVSRTILMHMEQSGHDANEVLVNEWRDMLSHVANDLKPPLAAFGHGCEILNSNLKQLFLIADHSENKEELSLELNSTNGTVQSIRSISVYLSTTLHQCIDYSRISRGVSLMPNLEAVDVHDCLRHAVQCVSVLHPRCRVELAPLPSLVSTVIRTDPRWLLENTVCLLARAAERNPLGCPVLVRLQLCPPPLTCAGTSSHYEALSDENMLLIEVEDCGPCVMPEVEKILFEEEFCHMQRMSGRSGLALYTLARRCEALQGHFGLHDRADGMPGSVLWFSIPYDPQEGVLRIIETSMLPMGTSRTRVSIDSTLLTPAGPDMNALRILLVEDSLPILKMARRLLECDGHFVQTAQNGYLGVQTWQNSDQPFDAILMDLQMPVMNGLEATRRIRMRECTGVLGALSMDSAIEVSDRDKKGEEGLGGDNTDELMVQLDSSRRPSMVEELPPALLSSCDSECSRPSAACGLPPCPMSTAAPVNMSVASGRRVLIIACSATADDEIVAEAYAAGADQFMPKPVQLYRLKDAIHMHYFGRHLHVS